MREHIRNLVMSARRTTRTDSAVERSPTELGKLNSASLGAQAVRLARAAAAIHMAQFAQHAGEASIDPAQPPRREPLAAREVQILEPAP